MKFSWRQLKKPFFVLAPMEGATDTVFRKIVIDCGKPNACFTEFTNVEGILSSGRDKVGRRLLFDRKESPIIAQIWGVNPNAFFEVARQIVSMGFDGVDINMGCPEKNVVKNGACSALILNPSMAREIIEAVVKGAPKFPISVKTRLGFKTIQTEEWISFLLKQNLDALTVHFRTQKEMSNVPAHWEEAKRVVELRNNICPKTMVIGNGDVLTKKQGTALANKYKLDGIMIGRGVFHNPYVFDENMDYQSQTVDERIVLLKKHLDTFKYTWLEKYKLSEKDYRKNYPPLKRFFKIYVQGFKGASDMREKLMETSNIEEAEAVLNNITHPSNTY